MFKLLFNTLLVAVTDHRMRTSLPADVASLMGLHAFKPVPCTPRSCVVRVGCAVSVLARLAQVRVLRAEGLHRLDRLHIVLY